MNKVNYHCFTLAEREEISRLLAKNKTSTSISKRLNRHKSAISREVNRAGMDKYTYRSHKAHWHAIKQKRKQGRRRKLDKNKDLRQFVFDKLKLRWSPDQIAKELKYKYPDSKYLTKPSIAISMFCPEDLLKKSFCRI